MIAETLVEKNLSTTVTIAMPRQAGPLVREIWENEIYNRRYRLSPGDVVVDVGANIGVFSLYAAARGAKVFSFEPNPKTFSLLETNIGKNGFAGKIIPLNIAVAAHAGSATLYMARSDRLYAEGSATIMPDLVTDMEEKFGQAEFETFRVQTRRLPDLADLLGIGRIDFLKLDCEGAEFDILTSLSVKEAGRIRHLAMETHGACYSQRELCRLLENKGFVITGFVKAEEPHLTGYAYCRYRDADGPDALKKPVAIVTLPEADAKQYLPADRTLIADAGESFVLNAQAERPAVSWAVDGTTLPDTGERLTHLFTETGRHRVSLTVGFGAEKDEAEQHFTVLSPDYAAAEPDVVLTELRDETGLSREVTVRIETRTQFFIPPEYLPTTGEERVSVFVERITHPAPVPEMFHERLPLLMWNGKKRIITDRKEEVILRDIPRERGVAFSLEPHIFTAPIDVVIAWGLPQATHEVREGNEPAVLAESGANGLFRFSGGKTFRISHNMFPDTWTPTAIVVVVRPERIGNRREELAGMFVHKDERFHLSGWRREIRLTGPDPEQDITFRLEVPVHGCFRIVWWAE
ncbi:MAG TPA: FkbM family methyltransferase [Spirochaetia bacterium]|nr:FkbM family methyltransferase [Spirochaetia bacterium]